MARNREVSDGAIIGGALGVIVWLFDFRHLVLGGAPDTIISNAIRNFLTFGDRPILDSICEFGQMGVNHVCVSLATLFILVVVGFISGGIVMRLFQKARGETESS